jgi:hypothetical protein
MLTFGNRVVASFKNWMPDILQRLIANPSYNLGYTYPAPMTTIRMGFGTNAVGSGSMLKLYYHEMEEQM